LKSSLSYFIYFVDFVYLLFWIRSISWFFSWTDQFDLCNKACFALSLSFYDNPSSISSNSFIYFIHSYLFLRLFHWFTHLFVIYSSFIHYLFIQSHTFSFIYFHYLFIHSFIFFCSYSTYLFFFCIWCLHQQKKSWPFLCMLLKNRFLPVEWLSLFLLTLMQSVMLCPRPE